MPQDIFGADRNQVEAWSFSGATLSFNDDTMEDLSVTSVNVNYGRQATKLRPLNSGKSILIVGRGNGSASMSMIVGPTTSLRSFIQKFGDKCRIAENVLEIRPGGIEVCPDTDVQSTVLRLRGCLIMSTGFQTAEGANGTAMVNGAIQMSFDSFEIDPS